MRSKLSVKIAAAVLGFAFAVYGVACSGQDNADERDARKLETNPDSGELLDGGVEAAPVLPYEDRTEIFPDTPSSPPTCSVEDGVELATIVDFEGGAPTWFKFDDGTAPAGQGLLPLDGNMAPTNPNWGLASVTLDPPRCDSQDALHIQGGPFSNWGGGLGSQYFRLTGELAAENDQPDDPINLYSPIAAVPTDPEKVQGKGVDASAYKGVALWARRGQNSQSSFRLILNDKYTSNEASRMQYNRQQGLEAFSNVPEEGPYCGRIRACVPAGSTCANGKVCNQSPDDNNWYCFDPAAGETVDTMTTPRCDTTDCSSANNVDCIFDGADYECFEVSTGNQISGSFQEDALFEDKPCTPHVFSDNFKQAVCYDPETDPVPPNENERCDNGWTAMITVTNNWVFYRIPWSEFAQNDALAVAPDFAFDSIFSINIGFAQGPVDFYIDDISFYR
jgi:hypothetical protein